MESQKKTLSAGVKKAVAIALMGAVCLTAAVSVGSLSKKVTVTDGNETVTIDTINPDTEAILSKTGKELAAGEILAPDDDSKGVWRRVLGPGTYRLNPEGYDIRVLDAINIPIGYAGVVLWPPLWKLPVRKQK